MPELSPQAKEFVRLMKLMGWSQSETARQIYRTPAYVNQICNGSTEPTESLMRLMKLTIASLRPDLEMEVGLQFVGGRKSSAMAVRDQPRAEWLDEIERELSGLSEEDRKAVVEGLKQFVKAIPKKPVRHSGSRRKAS
jgi:transcriptional regulator with XRE-family HTH domain